MKPRYKKAKDIKVGVVGYGGAFNMGKLHLEDMRKAGMTPRAIIEPDAPRLEVARKDYPDLQHYPSVDEMIAKSDVDLVSLITPHNTHAPLAIQCLKAGRHVVCEKPFAITTKECDAMIAAAAKSGAMLSTFHNRHWDGSIMRALEVLRAGMIGELVRIEAHMGQWGKPGDWWRSSKSISGGILYDWGVHLLEYGLQLADSEIVEVSGFAKRGFWASKSKWGADTIEDEGFAVVRFKNGVWMSLCMTSIDSTPKRGMVEVTGTKGTFWWDYENHEITVSNEGQTVVTKAKNPPHQWEKYYADVAAHLTTGKPLVITPEWARRPIHILDLAGRSAVEGKTLAARYK